MHVRWYGQSAFLLSEGERRLMIDPFGDGKALAAAASASSTRRSMGSMPTFS